jgi:hypothetical protein
MNVDIRDCDLALLQELQQHWANKWLFLDEKGFKDSNISKKYQGLVSIGKFATKKNIASLDHQDTNKFTLS